MIMCHEICEASTSIGSSYSLQWKSYERMQQTTGALKYEKRRSSFSTATTRPPTTLKLTSTAVMLFFLVLFLHSILAARDDSLRLQQKEEEPPESLRPDAQLPALSEKEVEERRSGKIGKDMEKEFSPQFGANANRDHHQKLRQKSQLSRTFNAYWTTESAPSTHALISENSWARYTLFKEETCRRTQDDDYIAERSLNSTDSSYFQWEANEFHRQLRDRLLPKTRGGSFQSFIGSQLLNHVDPRLFVSKPRSLCKAKRYISEADERQRLIKEEQHMFEDFLINKVLSPDMLAPRRPSTPGSSNNSTNIGAKFLKQQI